MKKTLLLMVIAVMTASAALAQRTISGTVVDDQKEAVIQATVSLLKSDSTLVTNSMTNATGQFSLTAPKDGKYLVRVTYVGYKTLYRQVTMAGKPLKLGTLPIEVDAVMLKGAEVVKNVARVYSKEDTIVYNASAYKTPEGAVLEELVKRIPGAEVSDDGKITINGKEVKKIKVDGKEFMTGDTQTAMKNLPTSIVERVKAYDEKTEYLLGSDVLVAPVYVENGKNAKGNLGRKVYLPKDNWIHVFSGKEFGSGEFEIDSPIGKPPVFVKKGSKWEKLFEGAAFRS